MEASGGYLPIDDYALIGDCHGCALVAKTGRVDWCALGRFDADPVLCALLDRHRGGFLERQLGEALPRERAYVGETNILRSEFSTESARIEVVGMMIVRRTNDAGPFDYVSLSAPGIFVRRIRCLSGCANIGFRYKPSAKFTEEPARLRKFGEAGTGEFMGNLPQALTHLGLIVSAINLALFEKHGKVAVQGDYADRARRAVGATFGWRGILAAALRGRR